MKKDQANDSLLISELIKDELALNPQDEEIQDQDENEEQISEDEGQDEEEFEDSDDDTNSDNEDESESEDEPEETDEEEPTADEPSGVITKEFAIAYGLPKQMIGKPMDEVGVSYKNLMAAYQRATQELSRIKKGDVKGDKVKNSKNQETSLENRISELDPFDKDFNVKLARLINDSNKEAVNIAVKQMQEAIKPAQQYARKSAEQEIFNQIQEALPDGVNTVKVIESFKKHRADDLEVLKEAYGKKPSLLIKDIVTYYNSMTKKTKPSNESVVDGEENTEEKIRKEALKKTRDALQNAKHKRAADLSSSKRNGEPKKTSLVQELIADEEAIFNSYNT